jgi:tRNA pseudouridine55 synthase
VVVIDKPPAMTSFAVVKAVRRALGVRKAGHTGTLDPLATGVLPICVGEGTKVASLLLAEDKVYRARARLGLRTDTLDITGEVLAEADPSAVSREGLHQALSSQLGTIDQVPPAYSAIRTEGERAYQRARRGEVVTLPPRRVEIHRIALAAFGQGDFEFEVACSKGTYVRALVRDLGESLGCGATLVGLRRLRCGSFTIEDAVALDALAERGCEQLLPLDVVLGHLPAVELDGEGARRLRQGQPVGVDDAPAGLLQLRAGGELLALGQRREGRVWPKRVFRWSGG